MPPGRQAKSPVAGEAFRVRHCRLPRAAIGRLRFLVEGYDGLLFLRTLDPAAGRVELSWSASQDAAAREVLAAFGRELGLRPEGAGEPPAGA